MPHMPMCVNVFKHIHCMTVTSYGTHLTNKLEGVNHHSGMLDACYAYIYIYIWMIMNVYIYMQNGCWVHPLFIAVGSTTELVWVIKQITSIQNSQIKPILCGFMRTHKYAEPATATHAYVYASKIPTPHLDSRRWPFGLKFIQVWTWRKCTSRSGVIFLLCNIFHASCSRPFDSFWLLPYLPVSGLALHARRCLVGTSRPERSSKPGRKESRTSGASGHQLRPPAPKNTRKEEIRWYSVGAGGEVGQLLRTVSIQDPQVNLSWSPLQVWGLTCRLRTNALSQCNDQTQTTDVEQMSF